MEDCFSLRTLDPFILLLIYLFVIDPLKYVCLIHLCFFDPSPDPEWYIRVHVDIQSFSG